jgi:hypothetical protein
LTWRFSRRCTSTTPRPPSSSSSSSVHARARPTLKLARSRTSDIYALHRAAA